MWVPLRKGTNPLLSWSTWSVPPSPCAHHPPHLPNGSKLESYSRYPSTLYPQELGSERGKRDHQRFSALKIPVMSCSWLMMIFWLFWADSDPLPVLDLHFKKSNCWWTETINLWTPICHYATSKPSEMCPAKPNTFRSSSSVSWFGDIGSCQRPAFCNDFIETKPSKSQWKGQQDLLTKPGNMTVSGEAHYIFNEVASCLDQPWAMVLKDLHHGCSSVQSSSHIHPSNAFDPESLARWHGDMVHERTCFSSATTLLQLANRPKKKTHALRQITTKLWSIYWWIPTVLCVKNTQEKVRVCIL